MARGFEDRHEIYKVSDPRSKNGKTRIIEYLLVLSIFFLAFILGYFQEQAMALTLIKGLAGGLGYMAMRFAESLFVSKSSETKWSKVFIEKHAIQGVCLGSVMAIYLWQPEDSFSDIAINLVLIGGIYALGTAIMKPAKSTD